MAPIYDASNCSHPALYYIQHEVYMIDFLANIFNISKNMRKILDKFFRMMSKSIPGGWIWGDRPDADEVGATYGMANSAD
jgi:hypothetical protein